MSNHLSRVSRLAGAAALAAALAACGSTPPMTQADGGTYPTSNYPAAYPAQPVVTQSVANYVEFGRVTGVQVVRTERPNRPSGAGAVVGSVIGGVLGYQIGGGVGKGLATAAGAVGGAVLGNNVEKNRQVDLVETYRVSVQVDNGDTRWFDTGATTNDLRVGDRVRIENGQLYRG